MSALNPTADDTVVLGNRSVLRFHPVGRKIRDNTPRCIACGQIDEPMWHDEGFCPATSGALPFPTSTLTMKLKADSGFRSESSQRITLAQWVAINRILNDPAASTASPPAVAPLPSAIEARDGEGSAPHALPGVV